MEKTTVYLTSRQKAALALAAQAEGRSEATIIRAGIDVVVSRHVVAEAQPGPGVALEGLPQNAWTGPRAIGRPRWIDRAIFAAIVARNQADPGLRADLLELVPGTTDDEALP